jgi:hypothetical protein
MNTIPTSTIDGSVNVVSLRVLHNFSTFKLIFDEESCVKSLLTLSAVKSVHTGDGLSIVVHLHVLPEYVISFNFERAEFFRWVKVVLMHHRGLGLVLEFHNKELVGPW